MKNDQIKRIVIIGGGSAGWLTAGVLAAEHNNTLADLSITLLESPNINPIGVGEGTWPSMRNTLEKIGISETTFLRECDASFKQGSQFINWRNTNQNDNYYHPFTSPINYTKTNTYAAWKSLNLTIPFAEFCNAQAKVCQHQLAPKQFSTPEYAGVTNYGYHLDAGKFSTLLQQHCTTKLHVKHILDEVININSDDDGYISSVSSQNSGEIKGDLFIDCTGLSALLIGKHFQIPFIEHKHVLFNDSAVAIQVPYNHDDDPIASATLSTAQDHGWIWDIGLSSRRGTGYTFSSAHCEAEQAEQQLRKYISTSIGQQQADALNSRTIKFTPGHREKFWHKNCVAVGMASGFLEPLEASALAMVELSCTLISEQLPQNRKHMQVIEQRYNERFSYRWQKTIEFLKLHYILSQRDNSDYWLDNKQKSTIPETLQQLMLHWQYQPPGYNDLVQNNEIFPSASYQFVLYGMNYPTELHLTNRSFDNTTNAAQQLAHVQQLTEKFMKGLPSNRELLNHIKMHNLSH
jgi:hypothetical protein